MNKFFRGFKGAVCGTVAAAAAVTMSGCTNYTKMLNDQPAEYISMAQENTMNAIAGNSFDAESKLLREACKDGSLKLDFEIEGVGFSGELYVSEKDKKTAQLYKLTGTEGTSAELYFYTGKDGLKVGTNGNSGRHVYDITFEGFAEKLAASVFAPGSGSEYAMEQEEYDALLKYIERISSAVGESDEPADRMTALFKDFAEIYSPITEEKVEADIGGVTVSANTVTYSYSKDDIVYMWEELIDVYLDDYMDKTAFEYYTKDELKEQMTSVFDEIDGCELKIIHYVNSKSHSLMMSDVDLLVTVDNEPVCFFMDALYGAEPENSVSQSFHAGISGDGEEYFITADLTREENGSSVIVSLSEDGEVSELASFASYRDGEDYKLTLDITDEEIYCTAEGTVKTDKKSFDITLDKISAVSGSAEVSYMPNGVVTVEKGTPMPELDADGELLALTEEEFDTLMENLESDFTAVMQETSYGSEMLRYIEKSKQTSANVHAKTYFTTAAALLTQAAIEEEIISGGEVSGSGTSFDFGSTVMDAEDYLGDYAAGYFYGEYDPYYYSVEYIIWSEEPIPDSMKHKPDSGELDEFAQQGTYIGCYPRPY